MGRRGGRRKSSKEKAKVVVFSQLSGRVVTCMVREEEGRREGVIKREYCFCVCQTERMCHCMSYETSRDIGSLSLWLPSCKSSIEL